jgi:ribonucleotide monophosphatase NagD (HAD superfamily)
MAAILLDVVGVLLVSGEPIQGAADAIRRLRANGHRLRFVTNTTTRSRVQLADALRAEGMEVEDEEVQTAAVSAVAALRGRRVLALTMHALVGDLDGIELVGEGAEAVLLGGADDTPETNLVFSYMNLARAFAELELGAQLYCTATAGGRRSAGRCSTRVPSSRASNTLPRWKQSCWESRAPRTSQRRSKRSTPIRR